MRKLKVRFRKINNSAQAPYKGSPGAAAFDLFVCSHEILPYGIICYGSGLAVEIPPGHVGLLFSRSSISQTNLTLANCVGVIDSDYRGEIKAKFRRVEGYEKQYSLGERFCQLMIVPIPPIEYIECTSLSDTERGEGGFGSSGK